MSAYDAATLTTVGMEYRHFNDSCYTAKHDFFPYSVDFVHRVVDRILPPLLLHIYLIAQCHSDKDGYLVPSRGTSGDAKVIGAPQPSKAPLPPILTEYIRNTC